MGGSYAFSPIGYSGKAAGAGDTEDARWTTAIKYRVNIGDGRLSAMVQPIGLLLLAVRAATGRIIPTTAPSRSASVGTSSIRFLA